MAPVFPGLSGKINAAFRPAQSSMGLRESPHAAELILKISYQVVETL